MPFGVKKKLPSQEKLLSQDKLPPPNAPLPAQSTPVLPVLSAPAKSRPAREDESLSLDDLEDSWPANELPPPALPSLPGREPVGRLPPRASCADEGASSDGLAQPSPATDSERKRGRKPKASHAQPPAPLPPTLSDRPGLTSGLTPGVPLGGFASGDSVSNGADDIYSFGSAPPPVGPGAFGERRLSGMGGMGGLGGMGGMGGQGDDLYNFGSAPAAVGPRSGLPLAARAADEEQRSRNAPAPAPERAKPPAADAVATSRALPPPAPPKASPPPPPGEWGCRASSPLGVESAAQGLPPEQAQTSTVSASAGRDRPSMDVAGLAQGVADTSGGGGGAGAQKSSLPPRRRSLLATLYGAWEVAPADGSLATPSGMPISCVCRVRLLPPSAASVAATRALEEAFATRRGAAGGGEVHIDEGELMDIFAALPALSDEDFEAIARQLVAAAAGEGRGGAHVELPVALILETDDDVAHAAGTLETAADAGRACVKLLSKLERTQATSDSTAADDDESDSDCGVDSAGDMW